LYVFVWCPGLGSADVRVARRAVLDLIRALRSVDTSLLYLYEVLSEAGCGGGFEAASSLRVLLGEVEGRLEYARREVERLKRLLGLQQPT
jgi:hypothetical protein